MTISDERKEQTTKLLTKLLEQTGLLENAEECVKKTLLQQINSLQDKVFTNLCAICADARNLSILAQDISQDLLSKQIIGVDGVGFNKNLLPSSLELLSFDKDSNLILGNANVNDKADGMPIAAERNTIGSLREYYANMQTNCAYIASTIVEKLVKPTSDFKSLNGKDQQALQQKFFAELMGEVQSGGRKSCDKIMRKYFINCSSNYDTRHSTTELADVFKEQAKEIGGKLESVAVRSKGLFGGEKIKLGSLDDLSFLTESARENSSASSIRHESSASSFASQASGMVGNIAGLPDKREAASVPPGQQGLAH